jgi:DNA-binding transcriptional ArsR family regulator
MNIQIPDHRLDATFAALADPTRRAILARLASGEASVMELAEPFAMSQPAISKHLKVLERAGLISRGLDAQRRPRRLEAKPLAEATDWLERYREFWEGNFQRLDALLEELKIGEAGKKTGKAEKKLGEARKRQAKPSKARPKKSREKKRSRPQP